MGASFTPITTFLLCSLLVTAAGCRSSQGPDAESAVAAAADQAAIAESPSSSSPSSNPTGASARPDPWQQALQQSTAARRTAQSAQSQADWNQVVNLWQQAILLLEAVPSDHPRYSDAQAEIAAYQDNLVAAERLVSQGEAAAPTRESQETVPTEASDTAPSAEPSHEAVSDIPITPAMSSPSDVPAGPAQTVEPSSPKPSPSNPFRRTDRSAKVALAIHLQQTGAIMYGAYWCSYCQRQRRLFGPKAFEYIGEVECDPRGENPQTERCNQVGVAGYPTWEIDGQLYSGARSLEALADLSGYEGPRNF